MRIIPAIDIANGKCVRLTQGDFEQVKIYSSNPLDVAYRFQGAGVTHLHVVDLDGAKAGEIVNWKVLESLCTTGMQIDAGGGIRSRDIMLRVFETGVQQVNVGSIAVQKPEMVNEWFDEFPGQVILSADVLREQVMVNGWGTDSGFRIRDFIRKFTACRYAVTTDIAKDGMLTGPNFSLYADLIEAFPSIKWIASGGVNTVRDLQKLNALGVDGVIVGKAIYEGKIMMSELLGYAH